MEPAFGGVKSSKVPFILPLRRYKQPVTALRHCSFRFIFGCMPSAVRQTAIDRFLRQLRAGGRSNMYGAVPYVMKTFGVDRHAAFTLVCDWLDRQLNSETTEDIRARSKSRSR
jgi:hypothetical protein